MPQHIAIGGLVALGFDPSCGYLLTMIQHNSKVDKIYDDTIDEIHRTRARIAEKHGGSIAAIVKDAQQRQTASGRAVWQHAASKDMSEPAN